MLDRNRRLPRLGFVLCLALSLIVAYVVSYPVYLRCQHGPDPERYFFADTIGHPNWDELEYRPAGAFALLERTMDGSPAVDGLVMRIAKGLSCERRVSKLSYGRQSLRLREQHHSRLEGVTDTMVRDRIELDFFKKQLVLAFEKLRNE